MLKYVLVICAVAALSTAQQQQNPQDVQIVRFDSNVETDGYSFAYETSDGTSRQEEGKIDNPQSENAALTVTGQYSYVAPDGKHYTVTFTAGPNGYQPKTSLGQKYETSDGTSRQEKGKIDNHQSEKAALTVTGQYSYVAPDGKHYTVTITAGPNGYQPKTSLGQK